MVAATSALFLAILAGLAITPTVGCAASSTAPVPQSRSQLPLIDIPTAGPQTTPTSTPQSQRPLVQTPTLSPDATPTPTIQSPRRQGDSATRAPAETTPAAAPTVPETAVVAAPIGDGPGKAPVLADAGIVTAVLVSKANVAAPRSLRPQWMLGLLVRETADIPELTNPVKDRLGEVIFARTEEDVRSVAIGKAVIAETGPSPFRPTETFVAYSLRLEPGQETLEGLDIPENSTLIGGVVQGVIPPGQPDSLAGAWVLDVLLTEISDGSAPTNFLRKGEGVRLAVLTPDAAAARVELGQTITAELTLQQEFGTIGFVASNLELTPQGDARKDRK